MQEVSFSEDLSDSEISNKTSFMYERLNENINLIRDMQINEEQKESLITDLLNEHKSLMNSHLTLLQSKQKMKESFSMVVDKYFVLSKITFDNIYADSYGDVWSYISILLSSIKVEKESLNKEQRDSFESYLYKVNNLESTLTKADSEKTLSYKAGIEIERLAHNTCGLFRAVFCKTIEDLENKREIENKVVNEIQEKIEDNK